jgi:type IV secretion system protein VirB1
MVSCIAVGDGTALGIGLVHSKCVPLTVVKTSSGASIASDLKRPRPSDAAIITLGAGDRDGVEIIDNLRRARQAVTARKVIWLIPNATPPARQAAATVAAEWRDRIIDTRPSLPPGHDAAQRPSSMAAEIRTPEWRTATATDPKASLLACGSTVEPSTLSAIIRVESGGRPLAINVNGAENQPRQAATAAEATSVAQSWIARGYSVDLGWMQVNSRNLASLNFTVAQMFDPCTNIMAGASILTADYLSAMGSRPNPQDALRAALSAYNTGDFERGFYNGYVAKYYGPSASGGNMPTIAALAYQPRHAHAPSNPFTASPDVYSREATNE